MQFLRSCDLPSHFGTAQTFVQGRLIHLAWHAVVETATTSWTENDKKDNSADGRDASERAKKLGPKTFIRQGG